MARQLTLLDFEVFHRITLKEMVDCGWIGKNKQQAAPNIHTMTTRFNRVNTQIPR